MSAIEQYVPAEANRVIIAANPRAGAGSSARRVERLAVVLREKRFRVDVLTDLGSVAREAARAAASGSLRALVAAGGDGTVSELVNRTEPGIPITVLPLGTANLLAGYLRISSDVVAFSRMLAQGRLLRLDAGLANQRIFLLMVGCGLDGDVVRRLHEGRQGHINFLSYAKPILQSVRNYDYPDLRISCDAAPWDPMPGGEAARWAFVVNLPCYAARILVAPQANGHDGLLDLCTFARGSVWDALRYLSHVWVGQHARLPDCRATRAARVHIEADRPVPYQLDGDPGGMLPLEIETLPGRLTLVLPSARAAELEAAALAVAGSFDR